jgi:hypothetical protein
MESAEKIVQLRQLLAEKFPGLRTHAEARPPRPCWPTGLRQIDDLLHGGLPRGGITELVVPRLSSGSALTLAHLLRQAHHSRQWIALIDGLDSFDPAGLDNATLSRLLWIRCRNAGEAMKACDLILRDGNLSLVICDLALNSAAEIQKIPAPSWFRFQRVVEQTSSAFLVISPQPIVGSAETRLVLQSRLDLESLDATPEALLETLAFERADLRAGGRERAHLSA